MVGYNQSWMPSWSPTPQYPQPPAFANQPANPQPQHQPVNNLLRVTGPESAKAYSLPPNSSVVLFDADNPVFYLKSTDDSGFASLRTFDFSERRVVEAAPVLEPTDTSGFATKDDLDALKAEFAKVTETLKELM